MWIVLSWIRRKFPNCLKVKTWRLRWWLVTKERNRYVITVCGDNRATRQTKHYNSTLRRVRATFLIVGYYYIENERVLALDIRHANLMFSPRDTRWRSWFRHCPTSQKVAGSIPDGVIGIFHLHNRSGRTIPGVDSASDRNEYQEYFLEIKVAGA